MRFFNIAGVCFPDRHYMLAPEPRLPDVPRLADQGQTRCRPRNAPSSANSARLPAGR